MKMLRFEVKKVFSKSKNKIAVIVLFIILIVTSVLTINSVEYVDEDGGHSVGISAARNLKEEKNKWSGYLTEDVFRAVLEENRTINNSKEALRSWKYWDIPMGANLQMIFYQSEGNPDVLVKFMLNEKDLRLPLEAVEASYYKWNEVYKFYIEHCDKVEKSLAETLKLSYEDF